MFVQECQVVVVVNVDLFSPSPHIQQKIPEMKVRDFLWRLEGVGNVSGARTKKEKSRVVDLSLIRK